MFVSFHYCWDFRQLSLDGDWDAAITIKHSIMKFQLAIVATEQDATLFFVAFFIVYLLKTSTVSHQWTNFEWN